MSSSGAPSTEKLSGDREQASTATIETPQSSDDYDEWEMEERLRHLERIYARSPVHGPLGKSGAPQFRFDSAHPSVPRGPAPAAPVARPSSTWIARLGQLVLAFGVAVTVCGGCLMAWSHYGARPDLMPLGIPIAIVGQLLLLVGLVLQFDSSPDEPQQKDTRPRNLSLGDNNFRLDDGPTASPQLTDLAARFEELSKKLEEREER